MCDCLWQILTWIDALSGQLEGRVMIDDGSFGLYRMGLGHSCGSIFPSFFLLVFALSFYFILATFVWVGYLCFGLDEKSLQLGFFFLLIPGLSLIFSLLRVGWGLFLPFSLSPIVSFSLPSSFFLLLSFGNLGRGGWSLPGRVIFSSLRIVWLGRSGMCSSVRHLFSFV